MTGPPAGWRTVEAEVAGAPLFVGPGQRHSGSGWLCERPLLFLQNMMAPSLPASRCLSETDGLVASPGGPGTFPHAAWTERSERRQTVQRTRPVPPPAHCARWLIMDLSVLDLVSPLL